MIIIFLFAAWLKSPWKENRKNMASNSKSRSTKQVNGGLELNSPQNSPLPLSLAGLLDDLNGDPEPLEEDDDQQQQDDPQDDQHDEEGQPGVLVGQQGAGVGREGVHCPWLGPPPRGQEPTASYGGGRTACRCTRIWWSENRESIKAHVVLLVWWKDEISWFKPCPEPHELEMLGTEKAMSSKSII